MGAEPSMSRVFVGPVEIAGYYSALAEALREAGLDAVAVDLNAHAYAYLKHSEPALPVRVATFTSWLVRRATPGRARRPARLLDLAARTWLLVWAVRRFDVFIFGFGETFLDGRDLPFLRRAGKRLIFAFNGTDARPSYVDGAEMSPETGRTLDSAITLARRKKNHLRWIERHADAIVSQPAFSHFFERPVVDFFRIGVPVTRRGRAQPVLGGHHTVRILHSPSDPVVKGSATIRLTVDALVAAGHPLELIELRDVPNETVRAEIARADFVIDQLYSDAPMVGFATEAAIAGCPAIVGGYAWPQLEAIYPGDAMPPVEPCHPDRLAESILRLATDVPYRLALGERARTFATTQWAPSAIAARYIRVIRGDIPAEWLFDPRRLRYVRGVGMTEDRAREIVARVLAKGGRAALQLADKPEVEQAFVDFGEGR